MNCARFQEQMLLWFGQKQLPEELRDHLAQCPSCRAIWQELSGVGEGLTGDDLFQPHRARMEQLALKVDAAVMNLQSSRERAITGIRKVWRAYAPVAAAASLALGIAIGLYLTGRTTLRVVEAPPVGNVAAAFDLPYEELDDRTVDALIYDFTAQHRFEASELLLEDLSQEELEYLVNYFEVGDLL